MINRDRRDPLYEFAYPAKPNLGEDDVNPGDEDYLDYVEEVTQQPDSSESQDTVE